MPNKKALISYVPVIHQGYLKFLEENSKDADLYILGKDFIEDFPWMRKEIRALGPEMTKKLIEKSGLFEKIEVIQPSDLDKIKDNYEKLVMPDEEVSRTIAKKYNLDTDLKKTFLMWDKHNSTEARKVVPDVKISKEKFDQKILKLAAKNSEKSSDWWRRIGSVVVKDGKPIIYSYNKHLPHEYAPALVGDPRAPFHKGIGIEISSAVHGEAAAISKAAREGIELEGASLYVGTFPCPPCAKLIALSGIKKLYYGVGYGVLDGLDVLKQAGVEIVKVEGIDLEVNEDVLVEYKK